jgi:phosphoribosylanthranilate isomerase
MCGITRFDDAMAAAEAGVDALGFVFAESPRRIDPDHARTIIRDLPPHILRFGVFVDESPAEISRVVAAAELDRIQLHGFEEPMVRELAGTRVVKAFRARDETVLEEIHTWATEFFFLDTWMRDRAGGTGRPFEWSIAARATELGRLVLAGGLTPDNVGDAIQTVRPFGVDVSSGIETGPGEKDVALIRRFVESVRAADEELARSSAGAR